MVNHGYGMMYQNLGGRFSVGLLLKNPFTVSISLS